MKKDYTIDHIVSILGNDAFLLDWTTKNRHIHLCLRLRPRFLFHVLFLLMMKGKLFNTVLIFSITATTALTTAVTFAVVITGIVIVIIIIIKESAFEGWDCNYMCDRFFYLLRCFENIPHIK